MSKTVWLLLIANSKSYTRFRSVPKAMTLDDLEQQNKNFIDFRFFAISGCDSHFKSKLRRYH